MIEAGHSSNSSSLFASHSLCLFAFVFASGFWAMTVAASEAISNLPDGTPLEPTGFEALSGWREDDHAAALKVFQVSCKARHDRAAALRPGRADTEAASGFIEICARALGLTESLSAIKARQFFENHFTPYRVSPSPAGLLTGYFEPELDGAKQKDDRFTVPLYARPQDLVSINDGNRPDQFPKELDAALQTAKGLVPHFDRPAIEDGALSGKGLELVYLADPVDAFFAHIQGSLTVRLRDDSVIRLGFAGKSGHSYTSIGRLMREDGLFGERTVGAEEIKAWLRANPEAARHYMRQNRSFIFFQANDELETSLGPVGGEGVQLTAGRSLAIDTSLHAYGTLIWVSAYLPLGAKGETRAFRRLMIAQDTGSAIVGPARADIFFGSGADAGEVAGRVQHPPEDFVVLLPKPGKDG